jgi:hypothetical protein
VDATCWVLLLHICIGLGGVSVVAQPNHPVGFYEFSSVGWKARWEDTDVISTLNHSLMKEICRNGFCVRYHRKCDVPDNPTQCDFRFDLPQPAGGWRPASRLPTTPLRIQAEDNASFRFAMTRLSILVDEATRTTIPFAEMDQEAGDGDIICRYGTRLLGGGRIETITPPGCER